MFRTIALTLGFTAGLLSTAGAREKWENPVRKWLREGKLSPLRGLACVERARFPGLAPWAKHFRPVPGLAGVRSGVSLRSCKAPCHSRSPRLS